MRAKLESAVEALETGIAEVIIAPGGTPDIMGKSAGNPIGTRLINQMRAPPHAYIEYEYRGTRRSRTVHRSQSDHADIPAVLQLINGYAAQGIMLPRTEFEISENIRDFTVAYAGPKLLGCGALHFYTPVSGEVRSPGGCAPFRKRGAESAVFWLKRWGRMKPITTICMQYSPSPMSLISFAN